MTTKPFLAESVETPDDTTLVLKLRSGVTFHDGTPMTADDVLWSLQRHADPDMEQGDEFENVASIEKTGDREITLSFKAPDALFLKALAGDAGIVWNKEQVEKAGRDFGTPDSPTPAPAPTGWRTGSPATPSPSSATTATGARRR